MVADLNLALLARKGIKSPRHLAWVLGLPSPCSDEDRAEALTTVPDPLPEDLLEALQAMLRAAIGEEQRLRDAAVTNPAANSKPDSAGQESTNPGRPSPPRLVKAEAFLRRLLLEVGPLSVLESRVVNALAIAQLPVQATELERDLTMALGAVDTVMGSSALPVLLEGVLLLGNYVNASSRHLGGAVGVTLESLSKLAHTRCSPSSSKRAGSNVRPTRFDNVLHVLVRHLEQSRPSFTSQLAFDLDASHAARDFDLPAAAGAVRQLGAQLRVMASGKKAQQFALAAAEQPQQPGDSASEEANGSTAEGQSGGQSAAEPQGSEEGGNSKEVGMMAPVWLKEFMARCAPRIELLEGLVDELEDATVALRQWFAEPPESSLGTMLANLSALREALPAQLRAAGPRPPPKTAAELLAARKAARPRTQRLRRTHTAGAQAAFALPGTEEGAQPDLADGSNEASTALATRQASSSEVPSYHEPPYSVVIQILRLGTGTLWLSWLFDWPTGSTAPPQGARQFEVEQTSVPSDGEASKGETVRWPCSQPPLKMDVPVGCRYTFRVRAVVLQSNLSEEGFTTAAPTSPQQQVAPSQVLWRSVLSAPIAVDLGGALDLRENGAATHQSGPCPASPNDGSSSRSGSATATARRRDPVASSLEAFLGRTSVCRSPSVGANAGGGTTAMVKSASEGYFGIE